MRDLPCARGAGTGCAENSGLPDEAGAVGMIGKVTGKLVERHPPQVIVDVHGIGLEIDVPMSTFYQLPATGNDVTLYAHLVVREDAHLLYGFASEQERYVFRQLLRISGVGARTALSVLSGLSVSDLYEAVSAQDGARLIKVPGIGKKTAERLLLELKDKLDVTVMKTAVAGGGDTRRKPHSPLGLG